MTPGPAVRLASVARHVTDCATRPGHPRKITSLTKEKLCDMRRVQRHERRIYEKSQTKNFHQSFLFFYFFSQQSNYSINSSILTVCFKLNDMLILQTDKNLLNMTKYSHNDIMANHVNSLFKHITFRNPIWPGALYINNT